MSHYDNCREGYCGCGQSLSVKHTCRVTEARVRNYKRTWTDAEWNDILLQRKELRDRLLK